jgi:hypothetical protein
MRALLILPLALLISGCWTPASGQRNPARYPWDQPRPLPPPVPHRPIQARGAISPLFEPRPGSNCALSVEQVSQSGIGSSGVIQLACGEPHPARQR